MEKKINFNSTSLIGGFRSIFLILLSITSLQSFSLEQTYWGEQSFNLGRLHTCAQGVNDIFCWGYDTDVSGNATDVPSLENVQQLTLGSYFGCAINGTRLNCWGNNDYGQAAPQTLNNVIEVAAGSSHACALSQVNPSQNQLTCWGDNSDGKITIPSGLNNPTQLSVAYNHSCVIDGATVKCWGRDSYGETTNKTLNNPTQVIVGAYANCAFDDDGVTCWGRESDTAQFTGNVLKVGLGFSHGCALIDDGTSNSLQCWGDNTYGQQNIPSFNNPTDLAVGRSNVCVIDNGNVICWGYKSRWESSETDITWQNAQQLTVGEDHFCALNQGTLVCFGDDHYGQVSIPNTDSDSANDIVDAFPTNPNETLDSDSDGTGDNSDAFPNDPTETQDSDNDGVGDNSDAFPNDARETTDTDGDGVGDNSDDFPTDPSRSRDTDGDGYDDLEDAFINDPTEWLDTDGDGHGHGNNSDLYPNDPSRWTVSNCSNGRNHGESWNESVFGGDQVRQCNDGEIEIGETNCNVNFVKNDNYCIAKQSSMLGSTHGCAIKEDQTLSCWGGTYYGTTTGPTVLAASAGSNSTCSINQDQSLTCWGSSSRVSDSAPTDLGPILAIEVGKNHACAIKADQTMSCWGSNLGESGPSLFPLNITYQTNVPIDLGKVLTVTAGGYHTCAIKVDQSLACWGSNDELQSSVPTNLGNVIAVEAGLNHTCAIKADNTLACWGHNIYGQSTIPANLGAVKKVATGGFHTCAIKADKSVACWGNNQYAQSSIPADLGRVVNVEVGTFNTCAKKENQTLTCWGSNSFGAINIPSDLGPLY